MESIQAGKPDDQKTVLVEIGASDSYPGLVGERWADAGTRREIKKAGLRHVLAKGGRLVPLEELSGRERIERVLRVTQGEDLSSRQLAKAAGVSHTYLQAVGRELGLWPRPKSTPDTRPVWQRIAEALAEVE